MLRELHIKNLALIEEVHLDFDRSDASSGLLVLTGETGAGKSILLQGLKLLFGSRGGSRYIRDGAEAAVVEAVFEKNGDHAGEIDQLLRQSGLEPETELILHRRIAKNGKNSCHINGSPVPARLLEETAGSLLTIASQHEHQRLLMPGFHLDFLDSAGRLWRERRDFEETYQRWSALRQEKEELATRTRERATRMDFLKFQLDEINSAALVPDEDQELELEKKRLKSLESLRFLGNSSLTALEEEVTGMLGQIRKDLEQLAALDRDAAELAEEFAGASFQIEEQAVVLRRYLDRLPDDDQRLDQVNERLDTLQRLKRKYGDTIEAVLAAGRAAGREIEELEAVTCRTDALARELATAESEMTRKGLLLSEKRQGAATALEKQVEAELAALSFDGARFVVRITDLTTAGLSGMRPTGKDRVEFFFSANPGEPEKPLSTVASGGELSRLLLAFKCVLSRGEEIETILFDEVDAGIGGQAAEAVAEKIGELACHHQVVCITHLPQIAARGHSHFVVRKKSESGRTVTSILAVNGEERVGEIARMLGGDDPSTRTVSLARELLLKHGKNE